MEVFTGRSISGSGSTSGFWYGAGADVMPGDLLSTGVLGGISNASLTANGVEGEIGGRHVNIFVTQHFGELKSI
ncbi:MAG: hypothetical protein L3J84_05775 [Gammaproteobacteria bacterium]|nr:hypothetical protein [Gammaproteobacteria bacterium]